MQNIKGKLLSNQMATCNTKEKKAGQVELACERSCYEFSCAFRCISRSCAGPFNNEKELAAFKYRVQRHSIEWSSIIFNVK